MPSINRWIVLFLGLTFSLLFLMLVPEENLVLRSVSITIIAVLSICYYLHERYSGKLSLQSDLMISISTLVQFLIPVFYLSFYYELNSDLDFYGYRYGYAITSFAALLGQISFFLGYESVKKSAYFPRISLIESSGRFFPALVPLLILIWIARFVLLATGTYYHLNRTDYQFDSAFFSVFAQLDTYGLIIVVALFLIAFAKEGKRGGNSKFIIATMVLIIEVLWYGFAGAREPLVMVMVSPILVYIFITKKIPKKTLAVLILVCLFLFPILGEYRYSASVLGVSEINMSKTTSALKEANERLENQDAFANLIDRFYDGKSLGYLLMYYPHDYDYELGATYKNIPFSFIPRFIYPDKPVFTMGLGKWYQLLAGGSMPTTLWGESFINFSWIGIILVSYILGLLMKVYDYIFIKRSSKPYWVCLYVFGAIQIMRLPMEPAVIWISLLLKVIVLAFFFTKLHSVLTKVLRGGRTEHLAGNS